jgi:hypothetical protein
VNGARGVMNGGRRISGGKRRQGRECGYAKRED